jgi:hypothetical protein
MDDYKEEGDIFRDPLTEEDDLYYRAAILVKEIEDWHRDNPEFRSDSEGEIPHVMKLDPLDAEQSIPTALVSLHRQMEEFLEIVAAHPEFRHLIVAWIVEIEGYDGLSEERMNIDNDDLNKDRADEVFGSIGGLYQAVDHYLEKNEYVVSEKSASSEGWTIGLNCNYEAAIDLCDKIHEKFKKAISRGMLTIRKSFWGYRLLGLSPANYEQFLGDRDNFLEKEMGLEEDDGMLEFLSNPEDFDDDYEDDDYEDDDDFE